MTFEEKVKAIFINFKTEELEKFSIALHVLDEHEDLNKRSVDELWLEITSIIEGRKGNERSNTI